MRLTLICLLLLLLSACAPMRSSIAPGVIPAQGEVSASDEEYGHEVMAALAQRYPLEKSDEKVNRVREVADKLSEASGSGGNPWHVYVFHDDSVKNAAATKGNYVFVWSGMLEATQNEDELAAVLAHEIGHVLAGHTSPTPAEETRDIISGLAGTAAGSAVSYTPYAGAARLVGMLVSESMKALIVNPESQRKELEADQIGLFLLADAGYDPQRAITFWQRAKYDPALSGMPVEFLSSHPSPENRFENLQKLIPEAMHRYETALTRVGKTASSSDKHPTDAPPTATLREPSRVLPSPVETWIVAEDWATVFASPQAQSRAVIDLPKNTEVAVVGQTGGWLRIEKPVRGFVQGRYLAPR